MQRLKKYIMPYAGYITFTVIIKLGGAVLELLIPYFMEIILDDVVPTGRTKSVILYSVCMLLPAAGCLTCNVIANRMSAVSSGKITLRLRHDLFSKIQSLSARQTDALTLSSAESRLTSDTYNFNQMLARVQRLGIRAPILLIGGILMMLSMERTLSLVLIVLLPFIGVIVYFVTKKSVPIYRKEQSVLDRTTNGY